MKLSNTPTTYGLISILFHWLAAAAVFGLFVSGLWMVDLGYYDVWYHRAPAIHKSVGVLLLLLVAARLVWRWIGGAPEPEPGWRPWEIRLAHWVHYSLLFGILVVGAAGYLITTAKGESVAVFNLFSIPATIQGLPRQADVAGEVHYWLAVALIGLAALHALAALKHHFVDRDATLLRMLGLKGIPKPQTTTTPHASDQQRRES